MIELSRPSLMGEHVRPTGDVDENARVATILRSSSFGDLLAAKRRTVVPLLVVSLGYIFGVALLAGFSPALMSLRVVGSFNVGYLLVVMMYVLCWTVSVVYVSVANRCFERRAADVVREFSGDAS